MSQLLSLFSAVCCNDADAVKQFLIANGNNVNELNDSGYSALYLCCMYGHIDIARILLAYGADIHFRDRENGWTPLHRALYGQFIMLSLILMHAGAILDPDDRLIVAKDVVSDSKKRRGLSEGEYSIRIGRDREGFSPMDLLSELLSVSLSKGIPTVENSRGHADRKVCGALSFGTADVMLGIALPNKMSDVTRPKRIEDALLDETVVQVAAARHHSLALTASGRIFAWGHGKSGRLGHGNEFTQPLPVQVSALSKIFIKKIDCGIDHCVALSFDLFVYTWGSNQQGQLGHGMNAGDQLTPKMLEFAFRGYVLDIAAGDYHCLCSTSSNAAYSWGSNRFGQLGLKASLQCALGYTPKCVSIDCLQLYNKKSVIKAFSEEKLLWCKIIGLSAGPYSSMLVVQYQSNLSSLNEVYQWGHGVMTPIKVHFGEPSSRGGKPRSDSSTSVEDSESRFNFPSVIVNAVQVAVGRFHYLAMSDAHRVYSWSVEPSRLCSGISAPSITQVESEMMSILNNSVVNGFVPSSGSYFSAPRLIEGLLPESGGGRIVSIAASEGRSCAVSDVGNLYSWDVNWQKPQQQHVDCVPRRVLGAKQVVGVATGPEHTLVLSLTSYPPLPLDYAYQMPPSDVEVEQAAVDEDEDLLLEGRYRPQTMLDPTPSDIEYNDVDDINVSTRPSTSACQPVDCVRSLPPPNGDETAVPSLKDFCQAQLAKTVNYKNVFTYLLYAEFYDAALLYEYCNRFIQLNFDSLLTQLKPSDLSKIVDALPVIEMLPVEPVDDVSGGPENDATSNNVKPAPTVSSDIKSIDSLGEAQKTMKSLKKKISDITQLQEKASGGAYKLSAEQQVKIDRKESLQVNLSYLEMLIVRLQVREERISLNSAAVTAASAPSEGSINTPMEERATRTTMTKKVAPKDELCLVSASESKSECPPVAESCPQQAKGKKSKKFLSMDEFLALQQPPQQQPSPVVKTPGGPAWKTTTTAAVVDVSLGSVVQNPPKADAALTPTTSKLVAAVGTPTKAKPKEADSTPVKTSSTPSTPVPVVSSLQNSSSSGKNNKVKMSLADFLQEPKKAVAPNTPVKPVAKTWGSPAVDTSVGTSSAGASNSSCPKTDFSKIQAEEETLRRTSQIPSNLKGNVIPWLIERRPRAESLDVVMQLQQIEQMEAATQQKTKPVSATSTTNESVKKKTKTNKK